MKQFYKKRLMTTVLLLSAGFIINSIGLQAAEQTDMDRLQQNAPNNWGKWGKNDEVGALNYLDAAQAKRGVSAVKSGKSFTLQLPLTHGIGPVFPGRVPVRHFMTQDESSYSSKKKEPLSGGMKYSDDAIFMYLQGTTHTDALGHAWYGDKVYGGESANSTIQGHDFVDVAVLGEKGVVGRGVLLDVGRMMGDIKGRLAPNACVHLDDLKKVAKQQKVTIEKRDILLIRTGSVARFYDEEDKANWNALTEPGLCYSAELLDWTDKMEIPFIAADNLAVEKAVQTIDEKTVIIPLHGAMIRDMGIVFSEIYWLEDLAADSAKDKQYTFLFTAAPLKMERGSGAPTNPVVIK